MSRAIIRITRAGRLTGNKSFSLRVLTKSGVNSDGTNFHVLKPGVQNEVTRYSPIWARDGQSVFCEDMANIYQIGLDGGARAMEDQQDRAER